MARVSFGVNAGTVTHPSSGTTEHQYPMINVGVVGGDVGSQVSALSTQMGSIVAQQAVVVTNAGTNAGTLGVTTLGSLITTGSADVASLVTAAGSDVVVSVNTANITTTTQLRKAFDAIIGLAKGGTGGFGQP